MEKWEIVLLTGACSLISSIITAILTSFVGYRNDSRKWIRDKRFEIYAQAYSQADLALKRHRVVFEQEYIDELVKIKPSIKLIASEETFNTYQKYFEFVKGKREDFRAFCKENDPRQNPDNYELDDDALNEFKCNIEDYCRENKPTGDEINDYLEPIYTAMRKDLGSNLK